MAIDVNKLIKDAQTAQATARAAAESAQAQAAKDKALGEVSALSKKQLEYANTLKPTLDDYEARLKIWANKIARGDKLSAVEQREFDNLVNDYKSVNKTIDAAIKRSNDILVEARRNKTPADTKITAKPSAKTTTATGPDAARLGVTAPIETPAPVKDTLTKTPLPSSGGKTKPAPGAPGTPAVTPGGAFTDSQNAARLTAEGKAPTGVKSSLDTLLQKTEFWFDLPDYIFKLDPKLGELLVQAVDEGWDPNTVAGRTKFLNAAALTPWWQKNAEPIRKRIVDQAKAKELQAAGEDISKTDYGLYMAKKVRSVKAQAKEAGATLDDAQATAIADKIYNGFLDDDPLAINALIVPYIGKVSSIVGNGLGGTSLTGFSGQALKDYQTLQGIAKANGFTLKDILPNISAVTAGGDMETSVLRGLADGSLDINRISQDARMLAAQGQPQYVRGLLSRGYDLQDIYAPYRKTMATELELNSDQIDLNDPTLRMAITDKGDMNLYDFKKALRQDNRWQYTGAAKEEVSNAALGVLRDFGFQG